MDAQKLRRVGGEDQFAATLIVQATVGVTSCVWGTAERDSIDFQPFNFSRHFGAAQTPTFGSTRLHDLLSAFRTTFVDLLYN